MPYSRSSAPSGGPVFLQKLENINSSKKILAVLRGQIDKVCNQKLAVGRCREVAVVGRFFYKRMIGKLIGTISYWPL